MINDIRAAMKYPKSARRYGIEGTVYVAFLVGKTGEVSDVRVLKGIQRECDAEAVRAVTTLNKWQPGRHKGQAVYVKFVLPIKFNLRG
jgi:protein TonB